MLEDLHMAGTVHRLDRKDAVVFRLDEEHVLPIPVPMARSLPQRLVEDLGRIDLFIIVLEPSAHIGDDFLENRPSLRVPEHHAGPLLLEMKKIHFPPELAMVASLRLFQRLEIGLEVGFDRSMQCRRCG